MKIIEDNNQKEKQKKHDDNSEVLNDFFRCLTMLEKALERLARQNWYGENQYPEIYFEIMAEICSMRVWVKDHKVYSGFAIFKEILVIFITEISNQVCILIETSRSSSGKKTKKTFLQKQQAKIYRSVDLMLKHLLDYPAKLDKFDSEISNELEKALINSFENDCVKKRECRRGCLVSQRGEKSYIFPWSDWEQYNELVSDKKKFKNEVVKELSNNNKHATGHKLGCKCRKNYIMRGFRKEPRKIVMPGGKKHEFPIRMVQCTECGQRFSLLPSFIPREKHFSIDIIGQVLRGIVLFGQSISGAFEGIGICGRKLKSRQTLYNWIRWAGTFHPAIVLVRAGAQCSGYFQEDEGFEKEPGLRTYTVVMVDPQTQVVWHMDYTDHVDEKTLCTSFENFLEKINFSVKGIAKDKWQASTKAIKSVFYRVWIGLCHLHCLKNFDKALVMYQKESNCSEKDRKELYRKFKKVLDTAMYAGSLRAKLKSLDDKAFEHPLLKKHVDELRDNAAHYTSHKRRSGITKTTSKVDNFLKIIKRKLRQVTSFRDKDYAKILFNATANIRNFVPFLSGSKNAHQSPFILAGGDTYDLPWMQVMNVHNAFLFTSNAF